MIIILNIIFNIIIQYNIVIIIIADNNYCVIYIHIYKTSYHYKLIIYKWLHAIHSTSYSMVNTMRADYSFVMSNKMCLLPPVTDSIIE